MLQELVIQNFAIIDDLTVRFEDGLNILSGETGVGKSIIIQAVNLLLGGRASARDIRTGAKKAELFARFALDADSAVAASMNAHNYDIKEGLLVRRVLSSDDRHRIYVNDQPATLGLLAQLTANLASVSGQHAHQRLLKEEYHLTILDQYANTLALRGKVAASHGRIEPLLRALDRLLKIREERNRKIDLLVFERDEILQAELLPDEDETVLAERQRLKNSEALYQTAQHSVANLYGIDGAVVEQLAGIQKALREAAEIDPALADPARRIQTILLESEDLAAGLQDYLNHLSLDTDQLDVVEERLDLINKLKRKYGGSLASIADHLTKVEQDLEQVTHIDDKIAETEKQLARESSVFQQNCRNLSKKRAAAAKTLAKAVEQALRDLRMADTCFKVDVIQHPAGPEISPYLTVNGHSADAGGMDRATFQIAPNKGEALKPLADIASGGELSRVVLAVKSILAHLDAVETVIFDEVDAGIGGGTAEAVGRKLAHLAKEHQIICITHLAQIAKFGEHHFRITKAGRKGRTVTRIAPLTSKERIEELARMIGGDTLTPKSLAHAKEMLTVSS